MSEYEYTEIHYVPASNWPFDGMTTEDGIDTANRLAPKGCMWAFESDDEPGYMLLRQGNVQDD